MRNLGQTHPVPDQSRLFLGNAHREGDAARHGVGVLTQQTFLPITLSGTETTSEVSPQRVHHIAAARHGDPGHTGVAVPAGTSLCYLVTKEDCTDCPVRFSYLP